MQVPDNHSCCEAWPSSRACWAQPGTRAQQCHHQGSRTITEGRGALCPQGLCFTLARSHGPAGSESQGCARALMSIWPHQAMQSIIPVSRSPCGQKRRAACAAARHAHHRLWPVEVPFDMVLHYSPSPQHTHTIAGLQCPGLIVCMASSHTCQAQPCSALSSVDQDITMTWFQRLCSAASDLST